MTLHANELMTCYKRNHYFNSFLFFFLLFYFGKETSLWDNINEWFKYFYNFEK